MKIKIFESDGKIANANVNRARVIGDRYGYDIFYEHEGIYYHRKCVVVLEESKELNKALDELNRVIDGNLLTSYMKFDIKLEFDIKK